MFSLDAFDREYHTEEVEVQIGGRKILLRRPKDIDRFVDNDNPLEGFPLWARVWQAAIVLADYVAALPVDPARKILEIGGGLGLVSIAAHCSGHRITFSDNDPNALVFARANALINDCSNLAVIALDWNSPGISGKFDLVLGSEISYRDEDIVPLENLFHSCLNPRGEVILCGEMRKTSRQFFDRMNQKFDIAVQKKWLRVESEETRLFLFRMRRRSRI
jgi:predicted nicotinamide N-methyase